MKQNNYSRIAAFVSGLVLIYTSLIFYPKWKQDNSEATISWDASGYYWYLPSAFIYKDLRNQAFHDSILKKYNPTPYPDFQQAFWHHNSGHYVMKYSSGMAVMELPFFLAGHLAAKAVHAPADGFSRPYQLAIQLGGLLMALLGLWYLRKLLLLFYEDKTVAITLIILTLATNYLNYAAIDAGMSHSWLFTLYLFLLLNTYHFYQKPSFRYALRIGLLVGMATLTRPTEIISCLIPLLWGMESISFSAIKDKVRFLFSQWKKMLLAFAVAAAVIFIQPLYWHYAAGEWIVYSYQGQGFSFRHPHFFLYTFSTLSGWLTYSPVMAFCFFGFILYLWKGKNKVAILAFTFINYYIVCSWDVWQYGGRAMIESYPVMLMLLAAFVEICRRKQLLKWTGLAFILLFCYYNFWFLNQAHPGTLWPGAKPLASKGLLDNDVMSPQYFWRVAGRWQVPEEYTKLKEAEEIFTGVQKDVQINYQDDLEKDTSGTILFPEGSTNHCLFLDKEHHRTPDKIIHRNNIASEWLRVQATFICPQKQWYVWDMTQFIVQLRMGDETIYQTFYRADRFLNDGDSKELWLDMRVPNKPWDNINIQLFNGSSDKPIYIDNLKVITFNEG